MPAEEKISFPYRIVESRHRTIKAKAALRGMSMQEFIDTAVDDCLGEGVVQPKSKELRDAHILMDTLYEHRDHENYEVYWAVIKKLLAVVRDEFGPKAP